MAIAFVLFLGVSVAMADEVIECDPGYELNDEGACVLIPTGGTPAWMLPGFYCSADQIAYTEWSECNYLFGVQFRQLSVLGSGCHPTVKQIVETMRLCDGSDYFGYSIAK